MPSFFSRFVRIGRLPQPLRMRLEPEGIIHVAERVRVRQRFSGSAPGLFSAVSVNRHIGLVVFSRQRLYALLPTIPRLGGPLIDRRWDAVDDGPVKVEISDSGVQMDIDAGEIDARFHGRLSLHFKTAIPDDVLAALPAQSVSFGVTPDYVFHLLGLRVRN
ncbi:hypothetical protein [Mycobacterium sp. MMS18-G62]